MKYILASIRFILLLLTTFSIYFAWWIISFIIPNKSLWRQVCFRLWARSFSRIIGMKIEVIGSPPKPPFFLVSNHLSYVDIPLIRSVVDGVFVAKSEIREWFLIGRIVADMETVFIDRQNRRDIPQAGEKILEKLDAGEGVIVFPEGTSTKGEEVLRFKSSLLEFPAKTDFPVHYMAISYRTPNNEPPAHTICWWGDVTLIAHMWKLLQIPHFEAILIFGDEAIQHSDRKELAEILWKKVSDKFLPIL